MSRSPTFLFAAPADPLQLIAEALAVGIGQVIGPVLRVNASEDAGRQHRRRVAGALFVRPVGHHDRVLGLHAQIIQRPNDLQPAQHAQHTVILSPGRLGVQMAADIDRQRIRVGAFPPGEHVAHLVQAHLAARSLAPALEQRPALGVLVGQGLAVVAARDARPDLGHLHQAVPQPLAIDDQILARRCHLPPLQDCPGYLDRLVK